MSAKGKGSVAKEMAGLVPLVGRIVRRRIGEWVDETRESLRETVREVREQLEHELDDTPEGNESGGDGNTTSDVPRTETEKKDARD